MFSVVGAKFHVMLFFLLCFAASVVTQDTNITIPLNNITTYENREISGSFITLNGLSTTKVTFSNVNKSLSFIVFQVHSHLYNITLYKNNNLLDSRVTGTNVGLVSFTQATMDTFYILNSNKNVILELYISVHGYYELDPIPGGCNLEFSTQISPYLRVKTESDYIQIDAAPGSVDPDCDVPNQVNTTFYMMYLPEMNLYADDYFDGVRKMMTLKNIENNGQIIPQSTLPLTRRVLSAYPRTGAVYVVVATRYIDTKIAYSVYVPNHSYGCSPLDEDSCELIDGMLSQLLCVALLFVGAFVCFLGHRFFKTEMFLAGFFSGFIISYILLALIIVVERPALLAASTLSGVFFGAIWLLFWWLYGIPVVAVLLPTLNLGFLLAAIFYYRLPGNLIYLEMDLNFWSPFILVMLLTALALVAVTYAANILCCAVLGAYATVISIDYYLGSNLKYIIINTIRRAVVPTFNKATLAPPFQWRDFSVMLIWVVLATLGFLFQHWHNRGRPPFPPPPRNVRPSAPWPIMYGAVNNNSTQRMRDSSTTAIPSSERTPLLA